MTPSGASLVVQIRSVTRVFSSSASNENIASFYFRSLLLRVETWSFLEILGAAITVAAAVEAADQKSAVRANLGYAGNADLTRASQCGA